MGEPSEHRESLATEEVCVRTNAKSRYKSSRNSSREKPGIREIFASLPTVAEPVIRSVEALMRGPSPFTPAEREYIYQYCSRANGCTYAARSHTACAIALGMPRKAFASVPLKLRPVLE